MGRTACTEPQCQYKGDLYLYLYFKYVQCAISRFRREVDENCALLGCYAAISGNIYITDVSGQPIGLISEVKAGPIGY